MEVICENCGGIIKGGVYNQRWCHEPECEKLRDAADAEAQARRREKARGGKRYYTCRNCRGRFEQDGDDRTARKWCDAPECQAAKEVHWKRAKRKWARQNQQTKDWYKIAHGERVSRCQNCARKTPNRLGLCDTCRREAMARDGLDGFVGNMECAMYSGITESMEF